MRHLDMPNLRERKEQEEECTWKEQESKCTLSGVHHNGDAELDDEFGFEPAKEAEERSKYHNSMEELKVTKTWRDKVKYKTWSDVVKGLGIEDELETTNSIESEIESEMFDSDSPNQLRAKRRKGQRSMHLHCNSKRAEKGQRSRQADQEGRSARN